MGYKVWHLLPWTAGRPVADAKVVSLLLLLTGLGLLESVLSPECGTVLAVADALVAGACLVADSVFEQPLFSFHLLVGLFPSRIIAL